MVARTLAVNGLRGDEDPRRRLPAVERSRSPPLARSAIPCTLLRTMGAHHLSVIPIHLEPSPRPRPFEKPHLLPGLWLEGMSDRFAVVAKEIPLDPTILEIGSAVVLDYPLYVNGLLGRLRLREKNPEELLKRLSQRHQDLSDCFAEHPLEVDVEEEDIRKLVMMSCILAGAQAVVINRPVLLELMSTEGPPEFRGATNVRHVWQRPRTPRAAASELDMALVAAYCERLEPYFQPTHWHSGRVAVAIGAFLAYVLGADPRQGYLALTTVFEALLSTDDTEITHKISERIAFMLESTEDGRYSVYKCMKRLYKTRSLLVHGAIENKKGVITYDTLRLDAKITIVPDQDYADIFDLCIRLFRRVLDDEDLSILLEKRNSAPLAEYYLRLALRS